MLQRSFVERHGEDVDDRCLLTLNHIAQSFVGGVLQVAAETSESAAIQKMDVLKALKALGRLPAEGSSSSGAQCDRPQHSESSLHRDFLLTRPVP